MIERLNKPKDDPIRLYEARLKGMTPDEAAAKIQKLEETQKRALTRSKVGSVSQATKVAQAIRDTKRAAPRAK